MTRYIVGLLLVVGTGALADTRCHADRYQSNTVRCDNGDVWRKDRYGPPTWRNNDGTVIRKDRYTDSWRVENGRGETNR